MTKSSEMFGFPQRLGKRSLFIQSCFASSKRPQLGEVGGPHSLCFAQPERCSLPAVAMICREMQTCQALLTSAQHVVRHTDGCMGLTRFGDWPGETLPGRNRTRVPPALHVICVPGQHPGRLLCRDGCCGASPWEPHPSHSHSSFLHGSGARADPVAAPKPLWRDLYQQAKEELRFLCRGPRKLVSQWLDCWFTVPCLVQVGSPGFPWESLNSGGWRS